MPDFDRIASLATGRLLPTTGMEIHFLKVLAGEAIPCSPEEKEWVEVWSKQAEPPRNITAEPANTAIADREVQILALRQTIEEQRRKIRELEQENSMLCNEIDKQNEYLAACHKTIQKYEPLPAPIVIDHEAEANRAIRRGNTNTNAFVIYSSTLGQD